MGMMSLYDLIQKVLCQIAQLPIGQFLFTLVSHMTGCLLDSDWSIRSHELIKLPLQFSTELPSSGGIN